MDVVFGAVFRRFLDLALMAGDRAWWPESDGLITIRTGPDVPYTMRHATFS